ncbi:MAG TPA: TonB-dependent receptor [Thiobacillus sp.]|nr:TonB-dependent receptor [Thiobacillus sp.]
MRQTPLALALGVAFIASAHADTLPEFVGETIVVTPSRFAEPDGVRPANVTVISRREIEDNPATTLPAILSDYAGIGARDLLGSNASNTTVDIRGFGAAAGQNTLVLVDGRRLNDIDLSGVVWSAIPLSAVERIEIVRGGASVLHGGGAVGGVVNIITRSPLGKPDAAGLSGRIGSFGTREVQVYGTLSGDDLGLTLTANRHRSDGYRDNNQNRQDSLAGDARWKRGDTEWILKFGGDSQLIRLPGARAVQPSIGQYDLVDDREGTSTPLDWAERDDRQLGLTGHTTFGAHAATIDLAYRNKTQAAYFDFSGFPDYRETDLDMISVSPRAKFRLANHTLIAGVDVSRWEYDLERSNAPANIGQPFTRLSATQRSLGAYLQDQIVVGPDWVLSAGARAEQFAIRARDVYDPLAPGAFSSAAPSGRQSEREYAWELGARYRASPADSLYAKAGRSFRFATVDEIYETNAAWAREFQFLKPQISHDLETGWETGTARRGGRLALYAARVKDEIHLDPYSAGIGNTNLPPLTRYGLELEGRTGWGALQLSSAYTLAFARFTDGRYNGVDLEGKDVPLVPRHKLALNLIWQASAATRLSASANYVSRQYLDNDEPNTLGVRIPAYTVVDTRIEHRAGNWVWAAAINNLFDEAYYTYAVRSNFTPDRYAAYPLPGRHAWLSAEYRFR